MKSSLGVDPRNVNMPAMPADGDVLGIALGMARAMAAGMPRKMVLERWSHR